MSILNDCFDFHVKLNHYRKPEPSHFFSTYREGNADNFAKSSHKKLYTRHISSLVVLCSQLYFE